MDEAEYCGRVSIMKNGRIAVIENPQRLKELHGAASMQEVFIKVVSEAEKE